MTPVSKPKSKPPVAATEAIKINSEFLFIGKILSVSGAN